MIINRLKENESTLSTFTTTGEEIIEGHILGFGDNYPCIVLYHKFEAKFVVIEFGYNHEGYLFREHDIPYQTTVWEILGHIDNPKQYKKYFGGKKIPKDFDFMEDIKTYYEN